MIDFNVIKEIAIPEGNVRKITKDDKVMWEMRLPSGYQEVEYIYIPDAAYINTAWVPGENATFNIVFNGLKPGCYPFGCGKDPRLACLFRTNGNGNIQVYNTSNATTGMHVFSSSGINTDTKVEIETYTTNNSTGSYVSLNKNKISLGYAQSSSFDNPMLLGAWQYSASELRTGEINLYYAKASIGSVTAFEIIPCYRKSDGAIGMYDVANSRFFTNAGSGSFGKGADV